MGRIMRGLLRLGLRYGGKSAASTAASTALGAAVGVLPKTTHRSHTQVFNVKPPITIYVRGTNCRVSIHHEPGTKVILYANMYRAFGLELASEQDEAGVYIVAKQKRVVGKLSRADFTLTVPPESHLVFHLTPGDVVLQDIDGMIEFPPLDKLTADNSRKS